MYAYLTTYGEPKPGEWPRPVKHWQLSVDGVHIADTSDEHVAQLLINIANQLNDLDQNT